MAEDDIPPNVFMERITPILRVLKSDLSSIEVWELLSDEERRMYISPQIPHPLSKIKPAQPMTPYGFFVMVEREKYLALQETSAFLRERYDAITQNDMKEYVDMARKSIEMYRVFHKEWLIIVRDVMREYSAFNNVSLSDSDGKSIPREFAEEYLRNNSL